MTSGWLQSGVSARRGETAPRLGEGKGCRRPLPSRDQTSDYTRRGVLLTVTGRGFDSPRLHFSRLAHRVAPGRKPLLLGGVAREVGERRSGDPVRRALRCGRMLRHFLRHFSADDRSSTVGACVRNACWALQSPAGWPSGSPSDSGLCSVPGTAGTPTSRCIGTPSCWSQARRTTIRRESGACGFHPYGAGTPSPSGTSPACMSWFRSGMWKPRSRSPEAFGCSFAGDVPVP